MTFGAFDSAAGWAALVLAIVLAAFAAKATVSAAPAASWPSPVSAPAPAVAGAPAAITVAQARPGASASGNPLTGFVTREAIETCDEQWSTLRAEDYEPDAAAVAAIRRSADVDVLAIVATWCPDTRRELPRFFKIADRAGWAMARVRLLAVDRTKKDAEGLTATWNVTRVPTFIFLRGGREIGRVVERPATTLEKDIAAILEPAQTPDVGAWRPSWRNR